MRARSHFLWPLRAKKTKCWQGKLYRSADKELVTDRRRVQTILARYNAIFDGDPNLLISRLREFMGAVGDGTTIMPLFTCSFYTAQHPLDPVVRRSGLESARPIRIGHDVWIGGGTVVLPGVTIRARSVVGAGAVVVHDVPPNTVVVGNPARVIRTLP